MTNLPDDLQIPTTAVASAHPLVVHTRAWQGPSGRRDAGEFPVLAIGWYGQQHPQTEPFAYLVFDRIHHEIFWVAQSLVDRLTFGQS